MKRLGITILVLAALICTAGLLKSKAPHVLGDNHLLKYAAAGGGAPTYMALQWTAAGNITFPTNMTYTAAGKPHAAMCWVKLNYSSGMGYKTLMFGHPNSWWVLVFATDTGGLRWQDLKDGSWQTFLETPTTSWSDSTWHHVAISFDGSVRRLYLDGVDVARATEDSCNANPNADNSFQIGAYGNSGLVMDNMTTCDNRWYTNSVSSNDIHSVYVGTRGDDSYLSGCVLRIKGIAGYTNGQWIPDQCIITNTGSAGSDLNGWMNGTGVKAVTW